MPAKKLEAPVTSSLIDFFEALMALPGADVQKERLQERKRLLEKMKSIGLELVDNSDLVYPSEKFFEVEE
jgi:hypothetical protein